MATCHTDCLFKFFFNRTSGLFKFDVHFYHLVDLLVWVFSVNQFDKGIPVVLQHLGFPLVNVLRYRDHLCLRFVLWEVEEVAFYSLGKSFDKPCYVFNPSTQSFDVISALSLFFERMGPKDANIVLILPHKFFKSVYLFKKGRSLGPSPPLFPFNKFIIFHDLLFEFLPFLQKMNILHWLLVELLVLFKGAFLLLEDLTIYFIGLPVPRCPTNFPLKSQLHLIYFVDFDRGTDLHHFVFIFTQPYVLFYLFYCHSLFLVYNE